MAEKLWGGRFKKKIDQDFFEFQKSINYDYKLAQFDVYHSLVHISALSAAGIISKEEERKLITVLREILAKINEGKYKPDLNCEDVHSDIYNRVLKKAGALALKMQTFRSRNDQVVYDVKMYCVNQYVELVKLVSNLLEEIFNKSKEYEKDYFIGYTHTQRAQVIYFSDYILAHGYMLLRDYERLVRFEENLKIYIGAGALAGSPLNPEYYKRGISISGLVRKHFEELRNSLDHVSDRDFIIEFLSILSIVQMHLSRMAEDFILYSTKEFDYLNLPEEFCTGSSLMPHKKNPDFLELVRGYTGKIYGNLVSILTTMKGLPLTYNRDMQLDKEPLFSSVETVADELRIMAKFIRGLKLKTASISRALEDETLYATEIADFLVIQKKAPFKKAHDIVGKVVRYAEDNGLRIRDLNDDILKSFHPGLTRKEIQLIMDPAYAVLSRKSVSRKPPKLH